MSTTVNPYLQGNFAPVHEEVTATELPVTRPAARGPQRALPAQRAQPGVRARARHLPLVHRRRHGARDPAARRAGRVVPQPLGALGRGGARAGRGAAARRRCTPAWTSHPTPTSIGHAGRTFAIVEAGARPYELSDELETIGPCDFGGTLDGGYTAHPKRDPLTGELYAVSYFFGWGDDVEVTIVDARRGCGPPGASRWADR